jgi:16S rRNA (guanine527-N7)-methyltransferase
MTSPTLSTQCQTILAQGCQQLGITLTEQQQSLLLAYTEQLMKWNKAYNLTAIRQPEEMLKLHILDSLSVVQPVLEKQPKHLIDVGTGPGLPGMVLAIMLPEVNIDLLDTNGKKTRFLTHCKHLFKLDNVTVLNKRVEQHQPPQPYDLVISRAFASISDMLTGCEQLVAEGGIFTPMKGQYPEDELAAMPTGFEVVDSQALDVPFVDAERHILTIKKIAK